MVYFTVCSLATLVYFLFVLYQQDEKVVRLEKILAVRQELEQDREQKFIDLQTERIELRNQLSNSILIDDLLKQENPEELFKFVMITALHRGLVLDDKQTFLFDK